jgi:hypothetical protein
MSVAMNGAIETREIVTVAIDGIRLRGTCHKPQGYGSELSPQQVQPGPVGILFLTWLWPRAGAGDSAVYWAESIAKCGYLAFRFDLPGLVDSDGDFSVPGLEPCAGAYAPALSSIADQLVQRFHLSALVVLGICDAAVTAIHAAARNENIKGLILLDPYFDVPQEPKRLGVLVNGGKLHVAIVKMLAWDRIKQSRLRTVAVSLLACMRGVYQRLGHLPLAARKKLPSNANMPLIRCWNQVTARRAGILVMRSPTSIPKAGEFDYIAYLRRSDAPGRVILKQIERAGAVACTRAFMERAGKEAVRVDAEQWLSAYFPSTRHAVPAGAGDDALELEKSGLRMDANVR